MIITTNKLIFSIIIPTYNRSEFIKKTLDSVLNQKLSDFEIIVVDDGSTDNTCELVKKYDDVRICYYKKENEERAAARNFGTKLAKGNYITFLDSDDILYQNHLSEALSIIERENSPEWFHLRYEIKTSDNKIINQLNLLDESSNQKLIEGNFLSCNAVFLRKDIAINNLFNETRRLSALEDWELWLRIASKHKIYYNNIITSAIINHDSRSVLDTNKENLIERFNVFLYIILSNVQVTEYYKNKLHLLKCSCYTYISLHLALTKKNRKDTLLYLFKGLNENFYFIFTRRFFAILKHLI